MPLQEPEVQPVPVPAPVQQKLNRCEKKKRDQPLQKPEVQPAPATAQQKPNRHEKNKTFATKPVVPKPKCKQQY